MARLSLVIACLWRFFWMSWEVLDMKGSIFWNHIPLHFTSLSGGVCSWWKYIWTHFGKRNDEANKRKNIFSKIANFCDPDPKISVIFMIFEVFPAFWGLGRAIFVVFLRILFPCINLILLSKIGSFIFSSYYPHNEAKCRGRCWQIVQNPGKGMVFINRTPAWRFLRGWGTK